MSTGKPDVKQDPQRSRDLGHLSFRGAFGALPLIPDILLSRSKRRSGPFADILPQDRAPDLSPAKTWLTAAPARRRARRLLGRGEHQHSVVAAVGDIEVTGVVHR